MKPGIARLPVIRRESGARASRAAHSASARPSFHRMAGRSTPPRASRRVAPCIWPESPIPRTAESAAPVLGLEAVHRPAGGVPPFPRVLLRPAGARGRDAERRSRLGRDPIVLVQQDRLDAGGAEIDAEIHPSSFPLPASILPSRRNPAFTGPRRPRRRRFSCRRPTRGAVGAPSARSRRSRLSSPARPGPHYPCTPAPVPRRPNQEACALWGLSPGTPRRRTSWERLCPARILISGGSAPVRASRPRSQDPAQAPPWGEVRPRTPRTEPKPWNDAVPVG